LKVASSVVLRRGDPRSRVLLAPGAALQKRLAIWRRPPALPSKGNAIRDLDRLQQLRLRHREADSLVRTDASVLAAIFHCAKIALPARVKPIAPPLATPPPKPAAKRRGSPRRSATAARISPEAA